MKKILALAFGFMVLVQPLYADWIEPYDSGCKNSVYVGSLTVNGSDGSDVFTVDSSGNVSSASKIVTVQQIWTNPIAADNDNYVSTMTVSGAKNSSLTPFTTAQLVAGASTFTVAAGDYTNKTYALNIQCVLLSTAALAITEDCTLTTPITFTGTSAKGTSITETVTCSTTTKYTSNAFQSLTSIAIGGSITGSMTTVAGKNVQILFKIGVSAKLGLMNNITAASDILEVQEAGSITTTYTVDTTYDTIDFATDPNGTNDYEVQFKAK